MACQQEFSPKRGDTKLGMMQKIPNTAATPPSLKRPDVALCICKSSRSAQLLK